MNNLMTQRNSRAGLPGVFYFKSNYNFVAPMPINYLYYVDDCQIAGDIINVDYTINDIWCETILSMAALKLFVIASGLNDYCYDYSVNGEHVQDSGTIDLDTFINENLNNAITAYLTAKRIGQNVN